MTENLLYHVENAARDAEKAWNTASSSGAEALQSIFSALQTLQAQSEPCAAPAAPNRILSTQRAFEADVYQLRTTVRRLNSIVKGLKRWQHEIETSISSLVLKDAFCSLLSAFEKDLSAKRTILESIVGDDVFLFSVAEWRRFIAWWSEQPDRAGTCGEAVGAIAFAEQVMQDSSLQHQAHCEHANRPSVGSNSTATMSPAMLSLKKRLANTKS